MEFPFTNTGNLKKNLSLVDLPNEFLCVDQPFHGYKIISKNSEKTFQSEIFFSKTSVLKITKLDSVGLVQNIFYWFDHPKNENSNTIYLSSPFIESWICKSFQSPHLPQWKESFLINLERFRLESIEEIFHSSYYAKYKKRNMSAKKNQKLKSIFCELEVPTYQSVSFVFVMSKVQFSSEEWLKKKTKLNKWISFVVELIDVLIDLRDKHQLCHNDLHLGNVRVDENGRIILIDFGRASFAVNGKSYVSAEFVNSKLPFNNFGFDLYRFFLSFYPFYKKHFAESNEFDQWMNEFCGKIKDESVLDHTLKKNSAIILQLALELAQGKEYLSYENIKKSLLSLC